ncbi:PstS family phosphate ABC transporter substrate-binding protein [Vacuolonema iberomarrocanum]|uniref:PstS family phosphate ABC transporter substrate-binding protein n=1 Tax=Vacuolonema iberomarrocanum TaxID=3454632 RepID=UPI0019F72E4B|nr:substrate-binding domain-containing protein [filamentous cyanobacterium LEGE 07170]
MTTKIIPSKRRIQVMANRNETRGFISSFLAAITMLIAIGFQALNTLPPEILLQFVISQANDPDTEPSGADTPARALTFAEFGTSQDIPAGNWFYGGSTTWAAIRELTDARINETVPGFQITYIQDPVEPPGSGNGIEMLIKGKTSFAHSSRPIRDEELVAAAQRGIQLEQIPVALDAIAVVVHPDLPIDGLTIQQLIQIYIGRITNWQELGGPDITIKPFTAPLDSGAPTILREDFFAEQDDFADNVQPIATPTEAIQQINSAAPADRGAIYLASARNLIGQCSVKPLKIARESERLIAPYAGEWIPPEECPEKRNQLHEAALQSGQYPLTRRLFVIAKEGNTADQLSGQIYAELLLTREGQSLIQEAGFVPLVNF